VVYYIAGAWPVRMVWLLWPVCGLYEPELFSSHYAIDRDDPTPNANPNPNYDPELLHLIFITPPVVFMEACITISVWHKNDLLSNSKISQHC